MILQLHKETKDSQSIEIENIYLGLGHKENQTVINGNQREKHHHHNLITSSFICCFRNTLHHMQCIYSLHGCD